jgi:hypothetical protein
MTGRGTDPHPTDTLHADDPKRDVQLAIVSRVVAILPERDDYMPVLQALLTPMHPSPLPHGKSYSPEWKVARTAWNARCRAWVKTQGRIPGVEIRKEDQRAYEAATCDVWARIEEGLL